jgi:tetratricopeptide (TPR) repeat protein
MARTDKKEQESITEKLVSFIQGKRVIIAVVASVLVLGVIAIIVAGSLSAVALEESSTKAEALDTRLAAFLSESAKIKQSTQEKAEEFKKSLGDMGDGPAKEAKIAENAEALALEEKAALEALRGTFLSEFAKVFDGSTGYLKARAAYLQSYLALESYAASGNDPQKLDATIEALKRHIDTGVKAPETGSVYLSLGSMLERKGDLDGALAAYREFISRFEETRVGQGGGKEYKIASALVPEAYFRIGAVLDKRGDSSKAVSEAYEPLVERYPDSQWTKLASDLILLAKGDSK